MLVQDLERLSSELFGKRTQLDSLWQEIADHFYPERADFTSVRNMGTDFAAGLMTTYPLLARRDLANSFSSMLRPNGKQWFKMTIEGDESSIDVESQRWLEWATGTMRRAMYDRKTNFIRATKECDNDFAAFGNAAMTTEIGRTGDTLLYRSWHLRDVAWCEGYDQQIDATFLKWKPTISQLCTMFPKTVPQKLKSMLGRDPYREVECRRAVMTADRFGDMSGGMAWVSVYYTLEDNTILEVQPLHDTVWTIPRWQTVSGSQYGHSPATVCALPDARLIQSMTRVILEAGEKFTNPPMIGVAEAIRGDVKLNAGGLTWVDAEYDERLGEVLRPLIQDKSGVNFGLELRSEIQATIREAFFLNKIELPNQPGDMTAYEVSQRVSEYIRQALPLFEPMELEYNGSFCELTFNSMLRAGAFGPPESIPKRLQGRQIRFKFESPLQTAMDSELVAKLQNAKSALALVADVDPSAANIFNVKQAFRDALRGSQAPATWVRGEEEVAEIERAQAEEQEAQKQLAALTEAAGAAKNIASAQRDTRVM